MSDWNMEYIKSGKGLPPLENNHLEEDDIRMPSKSWMKHNQFKIPTRLNFLSDWYPLVPWSQAAQLWRISVEEVLCIYNIETLFDLPFGQAMVLAQNGFYKRLEKAQDVITEKKNN